MNNKGQNMNSMWGLMVIAAVIVVSGIFMAFGAQVTGDIQDDFTANSAEYNVTADALEAQGTVAGKMNTMALVGVITIIIGLLMGVVFLVQRNFA